MYPGRWSSSVWCTTAVVVEVHADRLVVTGGNCGANWKGDVKDYGRRTIRCLQHVLVTVGRVKCSSVAVDIDSAV